MDRFLDGYEKQLVLGAGLSVTPGKPKVVIHTTETGPGSLQPLITHWRANWGAGLPHFIAEGSRYVQLLPLDVGAYTLENAPGGADTNRSGPAIQVEIVGYSANGFNDVEYEALGRWLADLVKAGVDIDLSNHPRFYGANEGVVLAAYNSPIRMGAQEYIDFNGFCGHQHTPENAHWDPGKLDALRVERLARAHLDPKPDPPAKPDDPEEEDMPLQIAWTHEVDTVWLENNNLPPIPSAFIVDGMFVRYLSAEDLAQYQADGVKDIGTKPEAWFVARTLIPRTGLAGGPFD